MKMVPGQRPEEGKGITGLYMGKIGFSREKSKCEALRWECVEHVLGTVRRHCMWNSMNDRTVVGNGIRKTTGASSCYAM